MAHSLSTTEIRHGQSASLPMAVIAVSGFALLTALGAGVRVPLPGSPVPMTLQTLVVILAGIVAGPRLGAASQVLYLSAGLCGLPIFATGSPATMGFLAGFVPAAFVAGLVAGDSRRTGRLIVAATAGTFVVFVCGVGWLGWWLGDGALAVSIGLVPFLSGAVVKLVLAVSIARGVPRLEMAPRG